MENNNNQNSEIKNAFVQVDLDGHFTNENHYLAWRGFSYFNYNVKLFKSHEINSLKITKETPIYAGVDTFTNCLKKIKIDVFQKELESYPESLIKYLGREFGEYYMKDIRNLVNSGREIFIKPLDRDRKAFDGKLLKNTQDLLYFQNIPDFVKVYGFGPVNIVLEHRVFVHNQKILDGRKYNQGDFRKNIDYSIVENAIKDLEKPPVAYCLDFGLTDDNRTILIEATDAWAFAPYGLDMIHFTNMIVDRWKEIVSEN